ncbi:hypothetical protein FACS1894179_07340 [Bacteroidia bacterium]|nr:hypothetical protein FACS1894179_07340 [Bacteroidia bacterium]
MEKKAQIKKQLEKKLLNANAFWSYNKDSCKNLSDRNLIKFVLINLDIDDINLLFEIYPKSKVKEVWLKELVPQGDFLKSMNICYAIIYFDIKKPLQYLRSMETRHFNKIANYG